MKNPNIVSIRCNILPVLPPQDFIQNTNERLFLIYKQGRKMNKSCKIVNYSKVV